MKKMLYIKAVDTQTGDVLLNANLDPVGTVANVTHDFGLGNFTRLSFVDADVAPLDLQRSDDVAVIRES